MYSVCSKCKAEFEARYSERVVDGCAYCTKPKGCCRRPTPTPNNVVVSKITKKQE